MNDTLSIDTLSIIVPVRDVEATLAHQVHNLLDILPDLTQRFEIILVDDGSRDHTVDIARELNRQYPQLRLIGHQQPLGREAAIKSGLRIATGETVLVQEDEGAISPTNLRRLWSLRHDRGHRGQRSGNHRSKDLPRRTETWTADAANPEHRRSHAALVRVRG